MAEYNVWRHADSLEKVLNTSTAADPGASMTWPSSNSSLEASVNLSTTISSLNADEAVDLKLEKELQEHIQMKCSSIAHSRAEVHAMLSKAFQDVPQSLSMVERLRSALETLLAAVDSRFTAQDTLDATKNQRLDRAARQSEMHAAQVKSVSDQIAKLEAENIELRRQVKFQTQRNVAATSVLDVLSWKYQELKREHQHVLLCNPQLPQLQNLPPALNSQEENLSGQNGDGDQEALEGKSDHTLTPPTGTVAFAAVMIRGGGDGWLKRSQLKKHGGLLACTEEGQSWLVVFANPLNALRWALELQHDVWKSRNTTIEGEKPQPQLSIGLHLGTPRCEVDPTDGTLDYFGPAVMTASRLGQAVPDGLIGASDAFVSVVKEALPLVGDGVECRSLPTRVGSPPRNAATAHLLVSNQLRAYLDPIWNSILEKAQQGDTAVLAFDLPADEPQEGEARGMAADGPKIRAKIGMLRARRASRKLEQQSLVCNTTRLRPLADSIRTAQHEFRELRALAMVWVDRCRTDCVALFETMSNALQQNTDSLLASRAEVRLLVDRRVFLGGSDSSPTCSNYSSPSPRNQQQHLPPPIGPQTGPQSISANRSSLGPNKWGFPSGASTSSNRGLISSCSSRTEGSEISVHSVATSVSSSTTTTTNMRRSMLPSGRLSSEPVEDSPAASLSPTAHYAAMTKPRGGVGRRAQEQVLSPPSPSDTNFSALNIILESTNPLAEVSSSSGSSNGTPREDRHVAIPRKLAKDGRSPTPPPPALMPPTAPFPLSPTTSATSSSTLSSAVASTLRGSDSSSSPLPASRRSHIRPSRDPRANSLPVFGSPRGPQFLTGPPPPSATGRGDSFASPSRSHEILPQTLSPSSSSSPDIVRVIATTASNFIPVPPVFPPPLESGFTRTQFL